MSKLTNAQKIGNYCGWFRENFLHMSLAEFCRKTNSAYTLQWQFEQGNSTNIEHVIKYWQCCETMPLKRQFEGGLFKCL